MKILLVGGGGREHAIIKKLLENHDIDKIYALPGNGGISFDAECIPIDVMDFDKILNFAKEKAIDFAIVGPDNPLAEGGVDVLESAGIPTFGPNKKAAIIEGSKVFAKELMKKYNIPTGGYEVFQSKEEALAYVQNYNQYPLVIKADGLAFGKGVIIAKNFSEAETAITDIMENKVFGDSGNQILIEEFLEGPEVTVLCFTDSKTLVPMVSSMDHKRIYDGDLGPNTGGMGVIAPNPFYTQDIADQCMVEIFLPTMVAMNKEGRPFKGCLYFGLMLTEEGPKVIEYNCRFGDPEAQAVLPLLQSDLFTIMRAVTEEKLNTVDVEFSSAYSCCVIAASKGYPGEFEKGKIIYGDINDTNIFHSGSKISIEQKPHMLTSGGRVLGVTALGDSLDEAIEGAYEKIKNIDFQGMYYRKDIGKKAKEVE